MKIKLLGFKDGGLCLALMQGMARERQSIKNAVNKIQEFVMNVQASLDTLVKWVQGVEDRISACEDQAVEMTR